MEDAAVKDIVDALVLKTTPFELQGVEFGHYWEALEIPLALRLVGNREIIAHLRERPHPNNVKSAMGGTRR
jgi:hypothetical protein